MKAKRAFTLVELTLGLAILLVMVSIIIGILNPIALTNKARDARRKKDIKRISVAFEDYYNDKGCYPSATLVGSLAQKSNCRSNTVFSPWLNPWPCDPNEEPYIVRVGDNGDCPKWYKVMTKLENSSDKAIVGTWTEDDMSGTGTTAVVNYGNSSGNISITNLGEPSARCIAMGSCYYKDGNTCQKLGGNLCNAPNCYFGTCDEECRVERCVNNNYK